MELLQWIKGQHKGIRWFFHTAIKNVLEPEQLRHRPGDVGNSIVWLMWHCARTEDMMVNAIIRGEPQILLRDDWIDRLGVGDTHIGTGLGEDEVGKFSEVVDPEVADQYWGTVADNTYAWLRSITPEAFDEVPDMEARGAEIPPILANADTRGAIDFWTGRTAGFLFGATVINHGYIHIGEMQTIRGRMGVQGWF